MNLSTLAENLQGVRFNIHLPDGRILQPGPAGHAVDWHIHSDLALRRILRHPQRELRPSYLNGAWDMDTRHLPALLQALAPPDTPGPPRPLRPVLRRLRTRLGGARNAPAPHWQDTNLWLSRLCLGEELYQGCAHYTEAGISMEQAQRIRCREIGRCLQLRQGQHLLELNAGWGATSLYLAEHFGVRVTGLVSTREQLQFAHHETRRRGLHAAVRFRLGGLRQCRGGCDRIIGCDLPYTPALSARRAWFDRLAGLLREDGLLWLQLGVRRDDSAASHWYLRQLPHCDGLPPLSEVYGAAEHAGLRTLSVQDLSSFRLQDLRTRAQRYRHHRNAIGQRFGVQCARHWEFLLAAEIAAVETGKLLQYDLVLGAARCRWPAPGANAPAESRLPLDITCRIPGLARDR